MLKEIKETSKYKYPQNGNSSWYKNGHRQSKEIREKIGNFHRGKSLSEEHKSKISQSNMGHECSEETKRKIGLANAISQKGKKQSEESKKRKSEALRGRTITWGDKISFALNRGLTPKNKLIRESTQYQNWRTAVFKRDNYTCVFCGQVGGKINADHIKRFSDYPEFRFDLNNGRTLCVPCHKKTDTFGTRGWRKKEHLALLKWE